MTRLDGGLIDRETRIKFSWNGTHMYGHPGDTLASALLANGEKLVGRSFKYHRPRGVFSAGSEEPNALVQLRKGAHQEPNTRATMVELFEGLAATSQNHRGPLGWDLMSANDLLAPFLSAGFYYKTFMWPRAFWEKIYEPFIRASAGLGALSMEPDPDVYDKGFLHCDILVIGAGPAGLMAALQAGKSGARVILADEDFRMGGRALIERQDIGGMPAVDWVAKTLAELDAMDNVQLMTRTTIYGAFDHGIYGAVERKTDHLPDSMGKPRQVNWRVYTKRAILCAGATERSIAFANNDRPGIMLAGAARAYANRYAVSLGDRIAVLTNNDDGWRTAVDLAAAGENVSAVIDTREIEPLAHIAGAAIVMGAAVQDTSGRKRLRQITLTNGQNITADCLAVSGGWSPNVHLTCHQRGRPDWREDIAGFVPGGNLPVGMTVAGSANGSMTLGAVLKEARAAANVAVKDCGFTASRAGAPKAEDEPSAISPFWHVDTPGKRAWIDLQNDVTAKDVKQANQEGYESVELLKRYTTLGMATDQGKTSNLLGLALLAEARGQSIPETGTTVFRPPYTPVTMGSFAGRARGKDFRPYRLTPSHQWAKDNGASFVEVGNWLRAEWYVQGSEQGWRDSVDREALNTRQNVGFCDVTTLGKIDIQGKDATDFINRVYSNGFAKLPVGKVRYGLMLREDGIVQDDGTTARLSENHYVMTTTTANAVNVYRHLDFCRQCLWPDMDVHIISVTDGWAQFAVAGPKSREMLQKIVSEDISNEAFPFMACGEVTVCGNIPGRLFRISFSGELAYEIAVPSRYGNAMMAKLNEIGAEFGAMPYGTEALSVLRIEKGHPVGNELTGQTTAANLGLGRMVSDKKDSIGAVMSRREGMTQPDGWMLMGLQPVDRSQKLDAGAHFVDKGAEPTMTNDLGWMTSVAYSPTLGHHIGLGFIRGGGSRKGDVVRAWDGMRGKDIEVEIVSAHFVDPEGELLRG